MELFTGEEVQEEMGREVAFEPEERQEEAQPAVAVKDPGTPSKREIEEHELTHVPHISWCAACVGGRSRDRAHKRGGGVGVSELSTVVMDYCFLGSE